MIIIKSAEFVTSAVKPVQYPPPDYPEIGFAGRSNVGKSSLINTLVQRKRLVKTSATPGRTQLINFFLINASIMMVDLPGYGYAKVPKSVQKQWGPMVEAYIDQRVSLRAMVVLLDLRRTPPGVEEHSLIDWLRQYPIQVIPVLTKADKLSKTNQIKQRRAIAQSLSMTEDALLLFSAKTGLGKDALWQRLETAISDTYESNESNESK
jgi:GTP-binding protein